jgi:hypothetical protein
MIKLETQRALRAVRDLPFCYVCCNAFKAEDETDYDHVPASSVFAKEHRQPLKLKTHKSCNQGHQLVDEKIAQMIGLRRGAAPQPDNRRIQALSTNLGVAVINVDVDATVWRWITAFHAALYQSPLRFEQTGVNDPPFFRTLVLPFPKASRITKRMEPVRQQHLEFVKAIKNNRFKDNLDRIECNKGQLVYECVWDQFTNRKNRSELGCIFALDVCDWKDLGVIPLDVVRGCGGMYMIEGRGIPSGATRAVRSKLILPNYDRFDPFAR